MNMTKNATGSVLHFLLFSNATAIVNFAVILLFNYIASCCAIPTEIVLVNQVYKGLHDLNDLK